MIQELPTPREALIADVAPSAEGATVVYATRWWILGTFAAVSLSQAVTWNIFGPVSFAAAELYGWSDTQIAWVANTANIGMLVATPPTQLGVARLGMRRVMLLSALAMVVCSALRLVPLASSMRLQGGGFYAMHVVSMFFNGAAAAWLNYGGPLISAAWFPTSERATATAVLTMMPYVGVSVGFLLGPTLLHPAQFPKGCGAAPAGCEGARTLNGLYMAEAAYCCAALVACIGRWPERPPTPPTRSAAIVESDAQAGEGSAGFREVFCPAAGPGRAVALRLWALSAVLALPLGVFSGWSAVLYINLSSFGVSSLSAGWLGCAMTLVGCVGGIGAGFVADRVRGRIKQFILLAYAVASVAFVLFGLVVLGYLPLPRASSLPLLYASGVVGGAALNCSFPLFFELALETTFGHIAANAAGALLSLLLVLVQVVYLAVPISPSPSGTAWMNYLLAGSVPCAALLLLGMRAEYHRLSVDSGAEGKRLVVGRLDAAGCF